MTSQRFEFKDNTSNKFWEITIEGTRATVHYGRIGTDGQTQVKDYPTPAEATAAGGKQIAEKLKKGYREVEVTSAGKKSAIPAEQAPLAAAKKRGAKKVSSKPLPPVPAVEVEEVVEDRDRMQAIILTGQFRSVIPPKLRKMMEQENEYVFLQRSVLYVGYDLDVERMYGSPVGTSERDFADFVKEFESLLPELAPFIKTDFEIYYFTYTGEYTATMWAYRKGELWKSGGWIGDFCRSRSQAAKDEFVDRNHLPLKNGEIEWELQEPLQKKLKKVAK